MVEVPGEGGLELGEDAGCVLLQLVAAHAQVGLLQLDPRLLDVVHHRARLQTVLALTFATFRIFLQQLLLIVIIVGGSHYNHYIYTKTILNIINLLLILHDAGEVAL